MSKGFSEVKLKAETERLKKLFGLGFELNLVWEPSSDKPLSSEVKNSPIYVYEVDERKAAETLRYKFLDYYVSLTIEPYKEVTNGLIRMMNDEVYKRKERIVEDQIESGSDHIHLRLLRGKEKQLGWFDTFLGRMAMEALTLYLQSRAKLKEPSLLFPCTSRNVNNFLRRMSVRAGLDWKVSSHDLRKFFATNLKLARVNDPSFNETLIEY